jgi:hypothetical protein
LDGGNDSEREWGCGAAADRIVYGGGRCGMRALGIASVLSDERDDQFERWVFAGRAV